VGRWRGQLYCDHDQSGKSSNISMNQVINKSIRYLLKGITPETKTSKAAGHCKETHECPSKGGEKAQNRGDKSATGGSISVLFIRSTTAERRS